VAKNFFMTETLDCLAMLIVRSPCQKGENNPLLGISNRKAKGVLEK